MPVLSSDLPGAPGADPVYVNDCYGSKTETLDVIISRVVPPRKGVRSKVSSFSYKAAGTAHTLTFLTVLLEGATSTKAESGQAVINVNTSFTDSAGGIIAANDWCSVQHEDGSWGEYMVSSVSALAITFSGNLSTDVEEGARVCFHGAATDHTLRQWTMLASTEVTFNGDGIRTVACQAKRLNEPIIVISTNATAAGVLRWLAYSYGEA
jgi:hypothetical protein